MMPPTGLDFLKLKTRVFNLEKKIDQLEQALQLEIGRGVIRDHKEALEKLANSEQKETTSRSKEVACKHARRHTDYEVGSGASSYNVWCSDCGDKLSTYSDNMY